MAGRILVERVGRSGGERMTMRSLRLSLAQLACIIGAVGCHDGVSGPARADHELLVSGRAERGSIVRLSVAGDSIVALAIAPASAAAVFGDSARLLTTGPITFSATLADRAVVTATIQVAAPPVVIFEGAGAITGRDIYSAALDGGELTRLTQNSADDVQPTVAAGVVVFTSYRDANAELYSIRLDGSAEQRLTRTASINETMPALSPDGRLISYLNDATGVTKVWLASRDMGNAARLSSPDFGSPAGVEASPAWNAASDRLAFVATAGPSGRASLFTASPTSGVVPAIIGGSGAVAAEFEPAWSPDGGRIAYSSIVNGVTQIFVRDLRTSAAAQQTFDKTSCGQPTWLADGRLVFVRFPTYTTQQLAWLDPAEPGVMHVIPTTGLSAQHPAATRQ